ncbi:MAG: DUF4422 domain-containing protein [Clostridium sp.]|nr:DUF4422 domain-containing protein [Clostridium sp.]
MKKIIYIAGAHSRARTLRHYIEFLNPDIKVKAFLVDDMSENPDNADGLPVKLITAGLDTQCRVYIGTRGVNHEKLTEELRNVGFTDIVPLTVELDRKLRNEYVKSFFESVGRRFCMFNELEIHSDVVADNKNCSNTEEQVSGRIYVAGSAFDKPLKDDYKLKPYEKRIQVGTELTDIRLADAVYDNKGDNISGKNKQYCELTGLYWLWKNTSEDYIGLVHYRRHFLLPDNWRELMTANDVDVVLPVPLYVSPNLAENFRGRHACREWDYMMSYLERELPEDFIKAKEFFDGNLYSPCNMLIVRKKVLSNLCEWMFPILDAVVAACGSEKDSYENRYPGFLSERLITYYFAVHEDEFNVVYADKNFLN